MMGVGCAVVATLSCGREPTGPGGGQPIAGLAWQARFPDGFAALQAVGSGGVLFSKVRVVLRLPEGDVARGTLLDTLVDFPSNATDLQITLSISLPASAPASGQPLELTLDYRNDAGATVFTGGPVTVTAIPVRRGSEPPPPSPVTIPLVYVGPGASAASVEIAPLVTSAGMGDSVVFTAQARDGAGVVIPNTPVVFSVTDTTFASINAVSGHGKAANKRGATTVTAKLLTGPSATAALTVTPVPAVITKVSGDTQNAVVTALLGAPLVVRVDAPDGLPMQGAAVTFAVNKGGGAVTASATTDANGLASATWTLGDTAGVQGVTASVGAGITANFTATAASGIAKTIVAVSGSAQSGAVGGALAQPFVVKAADQFGNPVSGVNITWIVVSGGGSLTSATTTTDALGLTQNTLTLGTATGANSVTAGNAAVQAVPVTFSATATAGAIASFAVTAPVSPATAGVLLAPAITVTAKDANGNAVTGFTGGVVLALATNPGGAVLGGTTSTAAVAGVATFTAVRVVKSGTGYALTATSGGTTGSSTTFDVTAAPAIAIAADSGNAQSALISTLLPTALVGRVVDSLGNGVAGAIVRWSVATGGGALGGQTTTTDANGRVRATWTLGALAGAQAVSLATTPTALSGSPVTFTATGTSALANAIWTGATSSAWNVATNWIPAVVPGANDSVLVQTGGTQPVLTANASVRRLTVASGATLNIGANTLTVGGNLDAGTTITGTGTVVLAGKTGTFSGVVGTGMTIADTSTYTLAGRAQVTGSAGVTVLGTLDAGGRTLATTSFAVSGASGLLKMANSADSVIVTGTATFSGSNGSGSSMTAGVLYLTGDVVQSTNTHAFAASSGHTTVLAGAGLQKVTFANPGTGGALSHFGTLAIPNVSAAGVLFATDAFADGQLAMPAASPHNLGGANGLLTTMGANVNQVTFNSLRWRITDGAAISGAMTGVTFQNMPSTTTYFTMERAGDASPYPVFTNWTFSTVPTGGGLYMDLHDLVNDASALTVTMTGTSPAVTGNLIKLDAGSQLAVLNGWANAFVWTGAASRDWATAANWNPPIVPTASINVRIPAGTPNALQVSTSGAAVNDLTIDPNATMSVSGGTGGTVGVNGNLLIGALGRLDLPDSTWAVFVNGNLTTDTSGTTGVTGCLTNATTIFAQGPASGITGKYCGLAVNSGTAFASGPVVVTGYMVITGTFAPNSNSVSVGNLLAVSGKLEMAKPADSVTVIGAAVFQGTVPSTLTNGKLVLRGDFYEVGNNSSFPATSGHTTILAGSAAQSVNFSHPGTGGANSHFGTLQVDNVSAAGVSFGSNVFIDGQLVAAGASAHLLQGTANQPNAFIITSMGANVSNVTFDQLPWWIVDGAPIGPNMTAVTFQNNCCNMIGSQFTLIRSDDGSTYPAFKNWVFNSLDGGNDQTVTGRGPLLTVTFTSPIYSSGFVTLTNARLIGWP